MVLDKKNELEIVKRRLQKAYSMTNEDKKKWSKKIRELEVLSGKLEQAIGIRFTENKAVKLLIAANKELSMELAEDRWGEEIKKYFDDNPKVSELLDKACNDIDEAFKIKSMTVLKLKIEKYKEAFKFIEKTYAETKALGCRELTQDEEMKVNKDLEQIGWL